MAIISKKCEKCGSTYIWRTPRHILERLVAKKAFVCRSCGHRILQYRVVQQKAA